MAFEVVKWTAGSVASPFRFKVSKFLIIVNDYQESQWTKLVWTDLKYESLQKPAINDTPTTHKHFLCWATLSLEQHINPSSDGQIVTVTQTPRKYKTKVRVWKHVGGCRVGQDPQGVKSVKPSLIRVAFSKTQVIYEAVHLINI